MSIRGTLCCLGSPEVSGAIFALDALEAEPDWSDLAA
jgi:hypothetical protein